jgi:segregation and condensation protein A
MAATLINLKARTLMPPQTTEEAVEEEQEVDEEYESIRDAQDLMRRLVEYRQFKELAVQLSDREEEQLRVFYRNQVLPELVDGQTADPSFFREDISLLFSAFARVLEITEGRPTHHVVEEEFTVEEKVETIQTLLNRDRRLSIYALFEHCLNKQECITTFLALLEVCRLKVARLTQKGNYQDILLVLASEYKEDDEEEED